MWSVIIVRLGEYMESSIKPGTVERKKREERREKRKGETDRQAGRQIQTATSDH